MHANKSSLVGVPNAEDSWVDRTAYPFAPHYFSTDQGQIHYVDEGQGSPIVMVHGTPVWSFLWRAFIKDFSRDHRCVAPDHLGFGLSDKPANGAYQPAVHAQNLDNLISHLGLRNITLVVHDFGGPIGLSYALEHPENVRRLVIFNTWMWPLSDDQQMTGMRKIMGGRFGRFLYTRINFSPRFFYPLVFGDRKNRDRGVQQQYIRATTRPSERMAMWTFARELVDSTPWYAQLLAKHERLAAIPSLILWGMKDSAFRPKQLERWRQLLPHAEVVEFPDSGHFVQEEAPQEAVGAIRSFLARSKTTDDDQ